MIIVGYQVAFFERLAEEFDAVVQEGLGQLDDVAIPCVIRSHSFETLLAGARR
jgi:hypothetical protein